MTKTLSGRIPDELKNKVNEIVEKSPYYSNKSDFFRDAIRDKIKKEGE